VTPLLFALATAAAAPAATPAVGSPQARFISCANDVKADPVQGAAAAQAWIDKGGGTSARQCLGMAYAAAERWPQAASAFDNAASEAERTRDPRQGEMKAAAASAWLAAGDAGKAKAAFDSALSGGQLDPAAEADARLDRARAEVALNDLAGARADLDKAVAIAPQQSLAWYLSAALAVKERDLTRAHLDIARAVTLSPNDASYLLEAGNIAGLSGEVDAAKRLFDRASRAEPDSEAGRAASAALAANGGLDPVPAAGPAPAQPR
jgi:tetratricopeptide (TPR) repeat protein